MAPDPLVVPLAPAGPSAPALQAVPASVTKIGFSTPKSFNPVSWLVKTVTGSKASHAFFVYHDLDFDMEMVMEAHELGFRLTPLMLFEKGNPLADCVNQALATIKSDGTLAAIEPKWLSQTVNVPVLK